VNTLIQNIAINL